MTIDELRLALQAEITDGGLRADGVRAWTEHVIYDPGDDTEP